MTAETLPCLPSCNENRTTLGWLFLFCYYYFYYLSFWIAKQTQKSAFRCYFKTHFYWHGCHSLVLIWLENFLFIWSVHHSNITEKYNTNKQYEIPRHSFILYFSRAAIPALQIMQKRTHSRGKSDWVFAVTADFWTSCMGAEPYQSLTFILLKILILDHIYIVYIACGYYKEIFKLNRNHNRPLYWACIRVLNYSWFWVPEGTKVRSTLWPRVASSRIFVLFRVLLSWLFWGGITESYHLNLVFSSYDVSSSKRINTL